MTTDRTQLETIVHKRNFHITAVTEKIDNNTVITWFCKTCSAYHKTITLKTGEKQLFINV